MIASVARNCIYLPLQRLRGEQIATRLREVRAFNRLPAEKQRRMQWDRLKALLIYLDRHNRYYRTLFEENSLRVNDFTDFEDLQRIPFLTKEIIQNQSDNMTSDTRCRCDRRSTSGSTGMPLRFTKDRDSLAHMDAVMHDAYSWYGIVIGDRHARIWGVPMSAFGRGLCCVRDRLLNRRRLSAFDFGEKACLKYFQTLKRFQPRYMYGLPGYMLEFAETVTALGRDLSDLNLKVLIATGEILHPGQNDRLKELFDCPVVNEYGMGECGIIAFECPRGNMHIMSHHLYVELIDPGSGQPVRPGEQGELVITELHGTCMPFIRYRTGDLAVAGDNSCQCGLNLPTIDHLEGRIDDMIVTPEGKKITGAILGYALKHGVRRFKGYQRSRDRLEVLLETTPSFTDADLDSARAIWTEILGQRMTIDVRIVDRIPPDPGGKLRCVVPDFD